MVKDIQLKCNGLHANTRIKETLLDNGRKEEVHINPDTLEVVVMEMWSVEDAGCVSEEFEVVAFYNSFREYKLQTNYNKYYGK